MGKERKDKGIKKERKEDISNKKKQRNEEGKKTTTNSRILYPSKRCVLFLHHSGSNPGPLLTVTGPIHCATDACCCCLSVVATYEYCSMAFSLACFCKAVCLMSEKHLQIRHLSMVL